mmetsp:Transcript_30732/g.62002  ORF Transcript_30732/g.62002 Transcript_30732/m.62002 type:complete len:343 (+) Transcript_30732:8-1036(+)
MGGGFSLMALPQWYIEWDQQYGQKGFLTASSSASWDTTDKQDLTGMVHLITGANAGIGLATARELARRKATVHMLCRNQQRGEDALAQIKSETGNDNVFLHTVDVSSMTQVKSFAKDFLGNNHKVDALINNAGVLPLKRSTTSEGIETCLATTIGGTFLLCGLLMPALIRAAPSVVINVSSAGMYTAKTVVSDLQFAKAKKFDGLLQYARVKRAQVALSEMWAAKLAGTGVCVHAMHPGYSVTPGTEKLPGLGDRSDGGFVKQHGSKLRTAEQGADTIVWMCSAPVIRETAGRFWFDRKQVRTSMRLAGTELSSKDKEALWAQCEQLTGYTFHDSDTQPAEN